MHIAQDNEKIVAKGNTLDRKRVIVQSFKNCNILSGIYPS